VIFVKYLDEHRAVCVLVAMHISIQYGFIFPAVYNTGVDTKNFEDSGTLREYIVHIILSVLFSCK